MTPLQNWLNKPRTTVRIDTTIRWAGWMKLLGRPFRSRQADLRPRIEVLDRLSLGGKKSLLLISIEDRRLLVGVGEDAAPSFSRLDEVGSVGPSRRSSAKVTRLRARKIVRA